MRIANIATYPAREDTCLPALNSIAAQVDVLNIALNEYRDVPRSLRHISNANFHFPAENLKDVGKFCFEAGDDDDVFLCDDDIIYPADYTDRMISLRQESGVENPVLGVHGVIYSDYYDGRSRSGRLVHVFYRELPAPEPVNQLGTGTIHVKGAQMPGLDFMRGSAGFVDIRFARHAHENGYPRICIARENGWMTELQNTETLYHSVTNSLPPNALREIQEFGGVSKIYL